MKYNVVYRQTESVEMEIEADNEEEAKDLMMNKICNGEVDFADAKKEAEECVATPTDGTEYKGYVIKEGRYGKNLPYWNAFDKNGNFVYCSTNLQILTKELDKQIAETVVK